MDHLAVGRSTARTRKQPTKSCGVACTDKIYSVVYLDMIDPGTRPLGHIPGAAYKIDIYRNAYYIPQDDTFIADAGPASEQHLSFLVPSIITFLKLCFTFEPFLSYHHGVLEILASTFPGRKGFVVQLRHRSPCEKYICS